MKSEKMFNSATSLKTKEIYEAPSVEIIEVMVERGVQASGDGSDSLDDPTGDNGSY
jgi:hypothetical protein